jgi:DNA-binding NtrC family response regulator
MKASNCWWLEIATSAWEAIDKVQSGAIFDLILLDKPQGDPEGLHLLNWLRRLNPALPIILIVESNDFDKKQESIRLGARDYLERPIDDRQLRMVIQRHLSATCEATDVEITSDDVEPVSNGSFFIGVSPIMRKLRAQAALLAEVDAPVLILGDDGSGKETTARLVHRLSVRSGFEFAKVNCAVLPSDLLEGELFGYERVSAPAPARTKPGKLELCAKGTILLDKITEMPLELQSKLLRVLQSKRLIKPGTSSVIEVDVRFLVASQTNIERAVSENRLRKDLYDRLRAYTIHVPPLRDRKEEIPFLSRHFMHQLGKRYGLSPRAFSVAIIEAWQAYNWPGNLRELEHFVKRYLMVGDKELAFENGPNCPEGDIQKTDSMRQRRVNERIPLQSLSRAKCSGFESLRSLVQSVKSETERNAIAMALEKTGWNRKAAARLLKVSYRTVLYKIEQYQMVSPNSSLLP